MRGILQFYKSFSGKLTAFMVFSFFVSGCHTGDEPVSVTQITVKKEADNRNQAGETQAFAIAKTHQKIPETPVNHSASGILLPEKQANKNMIYDSVPDDKNPDAAGRRDPFALPAALQKQRTVTRGNKCVTSGNTHFEAPMKKTAVQQSATPAAPVSQQPYVTGIFDNGKDKLALLRWKAIQGAFGCGESLGNGYYVKEITATAVSLYPEKSASGMKPVTLTLQQ